MAAPVNINANLTLNPSSINASAKQVQQALGRITGQASEFQKSLDASTARVFAFGATTAVINGVTQSFKQLVATTVNVQAKLIEINSILGAGAAEFNKYRNSIFQVAKTTGQSFNTVAEGAAELARQGLSATESAKRLEAALILTRISGLNSAQSVKALTAAMNGFTSAGLTANEVVNKIVAVDTAFAVSAQDLAEGFSRAGSTAEDAGVKFDELLALITAVEQRTARGGAVIGNAFKSIFTRLSRGSTIEDLQALGVAIDANQTGVQKLKALSDALEKISDPTVASQIKELAGGVFQINVVSAALKDIGSEASVFGKATKTAFDATNEATEKNAALNDSLLAKLNALVVTVTSLGEKIGTLTFGPLLENLVGVATTLSGFLDKALDPEKGNVFIKGLFGIIGKFIAGPGLLIFSVAFAKIFKTVIKFARDGFKAIMEMGSATEKVKEVEGGIIDLLQRDKKLRKDLTSQTLTQAQKEQAVIDAIKRQNQLLQQQEDLVKNIARLSMNKGVSGYSPSGGFSRKGSKKPRGRFAGGSSGGIMEPDLETAIINEAADAPYGASPIITTFRGQQAVMNTSETKMRIGGREEILTAEQMEMMTPRFADSSKIVDSEPDVETERFAFLVPKEGEKGEFKAMVNDGVQFKGGAPIKGPLKDKIESVSDSQETNLEGSVQRSIVQAASEWTRKLKPLGRVADEQSINSGFERGGKDGAKGAMQAAIGSAFEVAIRRSLNYQAAEFDDKGDFDIRGGRNLHRVQELFGISQMIGDFKVSDSDGNRRSFLAKIDKERQGPEIGNDELDMQAARTAARMDRKSNPQFYTSNGKIRKKLANGNPVDSMKVRNRVERLQKYLRENVFYNAADDSTQKSDLEARQKIFASSEKAKQLLAAKQGGKRRKSNARKAASRKGVRPTRAANGTISNARLKRYSEGSLSKGPVMRYAEGSDGGDGGGEGGGGGLMTVLRDTAITLILFKSQLEGMIPGFKTVGKYLPNFSKSLLKGIARIRRWGKSLLKGGGADKLLTGLSKGLGKLLGGAKNLLPRLIKGAGIGTLIAGTIDIIGNFFLDRWQAEMDAEDARGVSRFKTRNKEAALSMVNREETRIFGGRTTLNPALAEKNSNFIDIKAIAEQADVVAKQLADADVYGQLGEPLTGIGDTLLEARANYLKLAAEGKVGTDEFSKAWKLYISTAETAASLVKDGNVKLQNVNDKTDMIAAYMDSVISSTQGLNFEGLVNKQQGKIDDSKLEGRFLGLMTGPGVDTAKENNAIKQINDDTALKKIELDKARAARNNLVGFKTDEAGKLIMDERTKNPILGLQKGISDRAAQEAARAAGIDIKGENGDLTGDALAKAIDDHFRPKLQTAAGEFNKSLKAGAEELISMRIRAEEKIKELQLKNINLRGGVDPNTGKVVQSQINSSRVAEIAGAASKGPVDVGNIRNIVDQLGAARDSGNTEQFQNAMSVLNEALGGMLKGNEDAVLKQFGFDLGNQKNKDFFDKVGRESVVTGGEGKQGRADRDFLASLTGSGKQEKEAEDIDSQIQVQMDKVENFTSALDDFAQNFESQSIVDAMTEIATNARKAAENVNAAAEQSVDLAGVATDVQSVLEESKNIVKTQKEAISTLKSKLDKFGGDVRDLEGRVKDLEE